MKDVRIAGYLFKKSQPYTGTILQFSSILEHKLGIKPYVIIEFYTGMVFDSFNKSFPANGQVHSFFLDSDVSISGSQLVDVTQPTDSVVSLGIGSVSAPKYVCSPLLEKDLSSFHKSHLLTIRYDENTAQGKLIRKHLSDFIFNLKASPYFQKSQFTNVFDYLEKDLNAFIQVLDNSKS